MAGVSGSRSGTRTGVPGRSVPPGFGGKRSGTSGTPNAFPSSKAEAGIGIESSPFFTFYYLITGFHALHVVAGIAILGLVAWADSLRNIETAVAFWHMVDLVWVLLFPIVYLLR